VPGVEARDIERSAAQLMHKPWRHGASFDPDAGAISSVPANGQLDLRRV
jgi:hypothetical protein